MSTNVWSLITDLPEPHQAVSVHFKWPSAQRCIVEYFGPSLEALHAAGIITDDTFATFKGSRARVVHTGSGDTCRRSRWYGAYGKTSPHWRITWHADRELALTLPGVSQTEEQAEDPMVERSRCIGRHQRPVRWAVFKRFDFKLIYVDWAGIQARNVIARDGGRI
jgi:hypothetical protein